ncbi:methylated-DNA--[protein]-cysteine S-methyltransferase [Solitalea sp. MAHUQ-68]|uniref:methylated-DNA--[protein]-cysteine S-methyltransferase n=1 Tax=Solitalea agri TaxID=2953739 RepID=A0A9X2F127_9SPHI|nr:methylated-DNA--[protein]-cysteine S-methyltransferase [Solitalea agri]MCO4292170.1 methylated-DNA--[protein]-cysteine S-methyltransferase [Solitalea agri]
MKEQDAINFNRVAEAIEYMQQNFKTQPQLYEVAEQVNISPFHFQRIFTEWAGTSPKKFLQYISIEHAKKILKENQANLFETAIETGLSGIGRLHDLFINIEGMTPGEYKNGGENLRINYSFAETPFGTVIIASTLKGICYTAFADEHQLAIEELKKNFPNADYHQLTDKFQQDALLIFKRDWSELAKIKLHLKGTPFQLKVWETLLKIPYGKVSTYATIAGKIDNPKASRAVGSAVGDNPVAFLIPCHRVIQSTGVFGQYHWGSLRKTAMIGWEAAQIELEPTIKSEN